MTRLVYMLVVIASTSLMACSHTLEGIGKDMQELGKSIEKSSKN